MKTAILKAFVFIVVSISFAYLEVIPGTHRDQISKYYFFDYFGIFLILIAQSLLKNKEKSAFVIYIVGLILNGVFGYILGSYGVILFSIYSIGIFVDNWLQWNREEKLKASQK